MHSPYDHVDIRVKDMEVALPFYTALLGALSFTGPERIVEPDGRVWQNFRFHSGHLPCQYVGLTEEKSHRPSRNRVAFRAASRTRVGEIAEVVAGAGATNLEGPVACPEYSERYFAVFFADPSGNRLEVCCHVASDVPGGTPDLDAVLADIEVKSHCQLKLIGLRGLFMRFVERIDGLRDSGHF